MSVVELTRGLFDRWLSSLNVESAISEEQLALVSCAALPLFLSVGFFLFLDFLFIYHFADKHGCEFSCRITSLVHALTSSAGAYIVYCSAPVGVFESWLIPVDPLAATRPAEAVALSLSVGYFIADTLMMFAVSEMRSFTYFAHHFVSLTGLLIPIFFGRFGSVATTSLFWLESTNPHLNARWILIRLLAIDATDTARLHASVTRAKQAQPRLYFCFDMISKALLAQYFPARVLYLPIACMRTAVLLDTSALHPLYVAQGVAASLLTFFSIKTFFKWLWMEARLGPGSWDG
jgi:hypothetical protein